MDSRVYSLLFFFSRIPGPRWVVSLSLCFLSFGLYAGDTDNAYWKRDYSAVDSLAKHLVPTNDPAKLAFDLTSKFDEPVLKYRAIFSWIAMNIAYDCEGLHDKKKCKTKPEEVLERRMSVCQGYANLFETLCRLSGLECKTVSGWSHLYASEIGRELPAETTHAWNAIKLDNAWYLCDVTWAAGSAKGNCEEFIFDFKDFYFCTPPYFFSRKHFPKDTQWLLGEKLAKSQFTSLPIFYNYAMISRLSTTNGNGWITFKKGKTIRFEMTCPITVGLIRISDGKTFQTVKFEMKNDKISFNYTMERYSSELTVYFDTMPVFAYRVKKP